MTLHHPAALLIVKLHVGLTCTFALPTSLFLRLTSPVLSDQFWGIVIALKLVLHH